MFRKGPSNADQDRNAPKDGVWPWHSAQTADFNCGMPQISHTGCVSGLMLARQSGQIRCPGRTQAPQTGGNIKSSPLQIALYKRQDQTEDNSNKL